MAPKNTPNSVQFVPRPLVFNIPKGKLSLVSSPAEFTPWYSSHAELERAIVNFPSLTACQKHYGSSKPLNGAKITCSLHITPQNVAFVGAINACGANVNLCSSSTSSTDDHVAAELARAIASVLAVRGQTVEENLSCMSRALDDGPDLILDDGGVLNQLIHEGVIAEEEFARTGTFPDPKSNGDSFEKAMQKVISEDLRSDPRKYHKIVDGLVGFTTNNSRTVSILSQMQKDQTLLFPVMNVSKFAEGGPMNLSCNTGPPSVAKSLSLTTQVIALVELWTERSSGKYEKKVHEFPTDLADLVKALHHENRREDQADHISLEVEGEHQPAIMVQVVGDNQPANDRDGNGRYLTVSGVVVSVCGVVVALILGVPQLVWAYLRNN